MTDNRSRPRPADFVWTGNEPEPVQQEPTGPALGNYPAPYDRRYTVGERIARFLERLADRARGWH